MNHSKVAGFRLPLVTGSAIARVCVCVEYFISEIALPSAPFCREVGHHCHRTQFRWRRVTRLTPCSRDCGLGQCLQPRFMPVLIDALLL